MGKQVYVFSTLANDQCYRQWVPGGADVPGIGRDIVINGGAGVANDRLVTPLGVATVVSEEDAALLETNHVFKLHKKNGFIVVRPKEADPEKVAADMNRVDKSAPLTESSYVGANDNVATPA
ncbi:MAG: hypothetical protein KGL35_18570 [Bradyrhizobium sp.]|nr:hypothetical protein [Bradyrhizobium sp.]